MRLFTSDGMSGRFQQKWSTSATRQPIGRRRLIELAAISAATPRIGANGHAEELIAELGSCFLCADLGIAPEFELRADHASYLGSWLILLRDDKRAIFSAAARAQRAVAFLHGLQPATSEESEAA